MQTAVVDYIFEQLEENSLFFKGTDNEMNISISASDYLDLKRLAKEMEKQQNIDFGNKCIHKWKFGDVELGKNFSEQLYNETYGSKGSDETNGNNVEKVPNVTSSQTEISDEDIEKFAKEKYIGLSRDIQNFRSCFIDGMKKYREQLKSKQ